MKSKQPPFYKLKLIVSVYFILLSFDGFASKQFPVDSTQYVKEYVVYIKDTRVYFYNPINGTKFILNEREPVFNLSSPCVGNTLYYTVVRKGKLFLKKADINHQKQKITNLIDLNIDLNSSISETYGEKTILHYYEEALYILWHFNWDGYSFDRALKYSIKINNLNDIDLEDNPAFKFNKCNEIRFQDEARNLLSTQTGKNRQTQLVYKGGEKNITLTNNLKIKLLCDINKEYESECFSSFIFSNDSSKLCFLAYTDIGDLAHGPLCISDINGKNQKILKDDAMSYLDKFMWLKNNALVYIGENNELLMTNPINNNPRLISKAVDCFSVLCLP